MIRFIASNAQHIGSRQNQQDSFGFSNLNGLQFSEHGGFVAIVADGMGGLAHGDAASQMAVKAFLEAYSTKLETEPIPDALERSVRVANQAVFDLAVSAGAPGDVGTTLIAVAIKPDSLYWISVGDSAIYLNRGSSMSLLTTSHVYGRVLDGRVERGEISAEEAQNDPQREALTSYVGAPELHEIDRNTQPFPIRAGDMVVLATDGLFKTLPDEEIAATVAADGDQACDVLVRKTLDTKRQHQDNVTVCSVRLEEDAIPAARAAAPAPAVKRPAAVASQSSGSRVAILVLICVMIAAVGCLVVWRVLARQGSEAVEVQGK